MGGSKPNGEGNALASAIPSEENDILAFRATQNEAPDIDEYFDKVAGAELMPFPDMLVPFEPLEIMPENYYSCTHEFPETGSKIMTDLMNLNGLQNPPRQTNSTATRINFSNPIGQEENKIDMCNSISQNDMVISNNVVSNNGHPGSFQNLHIIGNFLLRDKSVVACQTNRQRIEGRSQINGNFVSSGCSTPVLYHNQNSVVAANSKPSGARFSGPQNIDGSFLTLGIGGNSETRPGSSFSIQEIASKLTEAEIASNLKEAMSLPPNAPRIGQTTQNSSDMMHKLAGGLSGTPNNVGRVPSTMWSTGTWGSQTNAIGNIPDVNTRSSGPSSDALTPQVDMHHNISMTGNRNSASVAKDSRYVDTGPHKGFQYDPVASSSPFNSSLGGFHGSGQTRLFGLAESAQSMHITSQPTPDLSQNCYMKTAKKLLPGSSMYAPTLLGPRESSTKLHHSGQLVSADRSGAAQAAGQNLLPMHTAVHGTQGNAYYPAASSQFPKRLGVDFNECISGSAAGRNLVPRGIGVYTNGHPFQHQYSGPVQSSRAVVYPPAVGQLQQSVPVQRPVELHASSSTTGQVLPVKPANGLSQASKVIGHGPLKRNAIQPPAAGPLVQRRKITPEPTTQPSIPYLPRTAVAPTPIPPAPSHIKWEGFDGPPQPVGHQCLLCKRDLSFTPEGPVYQPTIPPPVAVLPCGHTFHDHCLQRITPEDQPKIPPCIPCAIGKT